jgi:hypothetical protein
VWFYTAVRFDKPRMMMIKNISRWLLADCMLSCCSDVSGMQCERWWWESLYTSLQPPRVNLTLRDSFTVHQHISTAWCKTGISPSVSGQVSTFSKGFLIKQPGLVFWQGLPEVSFLTITRSVVWKPCKQVSNIRLLTTRNYMLIIHES